MLVGGQEKQYKDAGTRQTAGGSVVAGLPVADSGALQFDR